MIYPSIVHAQRNVIRVEAICPRRSLQRTWDDNSGEWGNQAFYVAI